MRFTIVTILLGAFALLAPTEVWGADAMVSASKAIVSKYKNVFNSPPKKTPNKASVDGPLLGNGDMLACIGGNPDQLRFYLTKNDFWQLRHAGGMSSYFGVLSLDSPQLKGAKYLVEQPLYEAETLGTFTHAGGSLHMRTVLCATENVMLVKLHAEGAPVTVTAGLIPATGAGAVVDSGAAGTMVWGVRRFEKGMDIPTACAVAMTVQGAAKFSFELKPGKDVTLAIAMRSAFQDRDCVAAAKQLAQKASARDLLEAHHTWWANYWAKSFVEIGEPDIERHYYRSNYTMGACSRDREFPPNIFGWITTDNPSWRGDYHLNYNFEAPFYGLPSGNHLEQSATYHAPILAFMERGKWYAKEVYGARGVLYPVGIGPTGIETTRDRHAGKPQNVKGGCFWGQKSNASYSLVPIAFHWRHSYDPDYAREVYPFVREVANFWESDLKFENGRYVDYNDAIHEGSNEKSGGDVNPVAVLGLIRNTFETALDMSNALGIDASRREKWSHILKHLSTYTTWQFKGKTVFRYTERGTGWWNGNTLGIQHIYPGNAIGLDSDEKWLTVARNTIYVRKNNWYDTNGSNSFFPAAVRVGVKPALILLKLRGYSKRTYPNGFLRNNPHGVENCSTVPNTVNMLLCMGHGPGDENGRTNVLRVFAVWPKDKPARFAGLRTWGAFIVSSEIKGGEVKFVYIHSERGQPCTVVNPWPGKTAVVYRDGRAIHTSDKERFTFDTDEGASYMLGPKTASHAQLLDAIKAMFAQAGRK